MYRSFYSATEKAIADQIKTDCLNIKRAAKKNWQASAWRLERMYPECYGRETYRIKQIETEMKELRTMLAAAISARAPTTEGKS